MYKEIPEAVRRRSAATKGSSRSRLGGAKLLLWAIFGLGLFLLLSLGLSRWWLTPTPQAASTPNTPSTQNAPTTSTGTPAAPVKGPETLLGHLSYAEAPRTDLRPIVSDGRIQLRAAAAAKYEAMVVAARSAGVELVPISGFRSIQDQNHLFFDVKAERGQVATERAQVSAPPGYSEHHTGYALDIGDAAQPGTNLQTDFEDTAAFRWLKSNAAFYSFELSFPRNNRDGVSYEPWHWRFVGNQDSLKTFYAARRTLEPAATQPAPTTSPAP